MTMTNDGAELRDVLAQCERLLFLSTLAMAGANDDVGAQIEALIDMRAVAERIAILRRQTGVAAVLS